MGLRFDLRAANWVAYLISPGGSPPSFGEGREENEILLSFLEKLEKNFYSSLPERQRFRHRAALALHALRDLAENWGRGENVVRVQEALSELRGYFFDAPWIALIVPSNIRSPIDDLLCSPEFLRDLVAIYPHDPGLILQLEEPPHERFSLTNVFPAFKTSLAESNRWPGFLLWTPRGDSSFFPLPADRDAIYVRVRWLAARLAASLGVDLALLRTRYSQEFPDAKSPETELTIVHLSDIHIGSTEASQRISRVQQLTRNLVAELGQNRRLIFAISGDLMDDPQSRNVNSVRDFLDFITNLGGETVLTCLGNHDVRKFGYLFQKLGMVMRIPQTNLRITWLDDRRVGLVVFNSALGRHLARGRIGEAQMLDIGSELDRKKNGEQYQLIGMLHHHPVPVPRPDWYSQPFYERLLGSVFEQTLELEDSRQFLTFIGQRRFRFLIHGHKHIPHISATPNGAPVFGCGSSVGKIQTADGSIYMSVNVVTLDTATGRVTARLLAERIPGGGLVEEKRHELISSSDNG
jgi:hypothetical protein